MLTGDTLFVGDVARPDLAIDKTEGAKDIYHSLQEKLLTLPAETEIWPGHLGGSMCGSGAMDPKTSTTLGYELRSNELLTVDSEQDFVEASLQRIGAQPPNFENIVAINRGELLTETVAAKPLSPRQLQRKVEDGAFLVDVRTPLQFDDAHIEGATLISILQAGFGSKLAWLADPEQEIVFVGRDDSDGQRAMLLGPGGRPAQARRLPARRHDLLARGGPARGRDRADHARAAQAAPRRRRGDPDPRRARARRVRARSTSPARSRAPWHDIDGIPDGVAKTKPVAAVCGSGKRAAVAASLLQRFGAEQVIHVTGGGVPDWAGAWRRGRTGSGLIPLRADPTREQSR